MFLSSSIRIRGKIVNFGGKEILKSGFHTAQKTIFPKPWNIMKSFKKPTKYQLSINFL